jgi:tRNA dimethylallyltransferase
LKGKAVFSMPPKILVIDGPTASGKTKLAVEMAKAHNGEVVSADSMQIYRRMDIGTAKPTLEEMGGVPHHMLDVADPEEDFSVARYVELASRCVDDILSRGKLPILAGGTGLYIDSLLSGRTFAAFSPESPLRGELERRMEAEGGEALLADLVKVDPEMAATLHPNNEKRIIRALEIWLTTGKTMTQHNAETAALPPRYDALTLTLAFQDRGDMWGRIDRRVDQMMADGLVAEVQGLLDQGVPDRCTAMQAIGYKEMAAALRGDGDVLAAAEEIKLRSRQYAKRQLTWFRRNEAAKWLFWGREPDFAAACQTSTGYMEEFGIG